MVLGTALKFLISNKQFRQQPEVYRHRESKKEDIIIAAETALVLHYKGNVQFSLNNLRVLQFNKKVIMSKSFVDPQALPLASSAAKFHSLRVYLQVQQWMGNNGLNPEEWVWTLCNEQYFAVSTHGCCTNRGPGHGTLQQQSGLLKTPDIIHQSKGDNISFILMHHK